MNVRADAVVAVAADVEPPSPYVGLIPYTVADSDFFFGRESETEIICANLRAARMTRRTQTGARVTVRRPTLPRSFPVFA